MANQLKKKFIGNDQVDGTKILLGEGQDLRRIVSGVETNVISVLESADAGLQSEIDAVEISIANEISNRIADVDAEESARIAAVSAEQSARESADTTLQNNITAEANARIAADALLIPLSQKGAANGVATLDAGGLIPTGQLPSYVDDVLEYANLAGFPVTGETGKIYVAIDTNKTYRWSGSVYIYITSGAVDSVNTKTGVVVLDASDIKMLDGTTTIEVKLNALQAEIDAEETARANADTALDGRLDILEAIAHGKFKKALISGDITNGYVDLPHLIKANSLVASVDRLAIHEGAAEDYTVSTVGLVSRITFLNSLVSPGNESLTVGDNVYFKYQY